MSDTDRSGATLDQASQDAADNELFKLKEASAAVAGEAGPAAPGVSREDFAQLFGLVKDMAGGLNSLTQRVDNLVKPAAEAPKPAAAPDQGASEAVSVEEAPEHPAIGEGAPLDRLHALEARLKQWEPVVVELYQLAVHELLPAGSTIGAVIRQVAHQLGHRS